MGGRGQEPPNLVNITVEPGSQVFELPVTEFLWAERLLQSFHDSAEKDKEWEPAGAYTALLGSCRFVNVPAPIAYGLAPMVAFARHKPTGRLAPTLEIRSAQGELLATVIHGDIQIFVDQGLAVVESPRRTTLIEVDTHRVLYDHYGPHRGIDATVSAVTHTPRGWPVHLHPDRLRLGNHTAGSMPNFEGLRLVSTAEVPTIVKGGIAIEEGINLYVMSLSFEGMAAGIGFTTREPEQ